MKHLRYFLLAILWLAAGSAGAQLAGKNLILVQGFVPQHIFDNPADEGEADGNAYWDGFDPALRNPTTTRILHYSSHYRLAGPNGIAQQIATQLESILAAGHCDNECIVITHSTGDLIMRFVLANRLSLLGAELAERFKVAVVIDLAGAGGGTELAGLGVDIVNGVNHSAYVLETLLEFLGFQPEIGVNPGVLADLQPGVARNTAVTNIVAIPRLRIAATGNELYGFATHPIIKGADDSVVPLHSSCGAAYSEAFDSCVQNLRIDGRVTAVSKAPAPDQLYDYHYPLIMSESMAHNEMQADKTGRRMTLALSDADLSRKSFMGAIDVTVEYETLYPWWDWFRQYRLIKGAEDKTMGRVILDSFE